VRIAAPTGKFEYGAWACACTASAASYSSTVRPSTRSTLLACARGSAEGARASSITLLPMGQGTYSRLATFIAAVTVTTLVVGSAAAQASSEPPDADHEYPEQPAGVPFPAADWPVADLPDGVDAAALEAAVDTAFGAPDDETRVASIVVISGGELVYERYHPRDDEDTVFDSWSMAKSFTSALVGLLVADGRLELDEHPERPEWAERGDPRQAITLRQLLQMSSGLEWEEGPDYIPWAGSPDAASFAASRPLVSDPGTEFNYSTGTTSLLTGIAADELGGCEEMDDYLHQRLLDPIGITTERIMPDARGCWFGGFGMNMTTRDFARFGLLYLRGGAWDGEQILPTSWIDETRVPASTNPDYGLQFWLDEEDGNFAASGAFGQHIVIVPEHDLVIAINTVLGEGDDCALAAAALEVFTGEEQHADCGDV